MKKKLKFVSAAVRFNRTSVKMSLCELSRRSKISKGALSKIENGQGNITVETLFKIADALQFPTASFLP
jgi:XRE family transcriptional regulator, regulator of sulfur utilization